MTKCNVYKRQCLIGISYHFSDLVHFYLCGEHDGMHDSGAIDVEEVENNILICIGRREWRKRERKERERWVMTTSKLNPNITLTPGSVIFLIHLNTPSLFKWPHQET